tara:strand:+ start:515 stop:1912 length:1398 start_codon:yes stop_codon:yes gene_type:complete
MKKGEILELDVKSLSYGGLGVAHYNDLVVFVKGGLPGQTVSSKIYKKKKKYLEAYVLEILKESNDQIDSICEHFGVCGGCTFQNYNYKKQLYQKQNQIDDLFSRIAKVNSPKINSILGCEKEYNYRNKMEFSYSPNRWITDLDSKKESESQNALGLHVKGRFDKIIDINDCHLHGKSSNVIFNYIKKYLINNNVSSFDIKERSGYLKNIIIREGHGSGEILINFVTTNNNNKEILELVKNLAEKFNNVKSIINTVVKSNSGSSVGQENILWGNDYINEKIGENTYKISNNSFFQTNTSQAKVLYDSILKICDFNGSEIVYDLYCGTGSIGIHIAKYVKKVYGVEIVMSAVIDAIENAKNNNVKNIQFFHGDLTDFFQNNQELKLIEKPDLIILDPPRAGIHNKTLMEVVRFNPKKIVYVSCNPSTQARDVNILQENNYTVKEIQPIDMFPHTPHIENITLLTHNE